MGKPRGIRCARKMRNRRRDQRWADLGYKKANLGTALKANPFGGASHAKGIVLEKIGVEAKQPNSAIRKCVRVQVRKSIPFLTHNYTLVTPKDSECVSLSCLDSCSSNFFPHFGTSSLDWKNEPNFRQLLSQIAYKKRSEVETRRCWFLCFQLRTWRPN